MEHISTTLIIPIIMIFFVVIPFVFIFLSVRRKITFVKEIKFGTVSDFRFIELDKEIYTELTIKNNVFLVYGKMKNIEEGIPVLLRIYTHQQYGLRLDQTLDIEYGHMIISVNGNKNFSTLEDF